MRVKPLLADIYVSFPVTPFTLVQNTTFCDINHSFAAQVTILQNTTFDAFTEQGAAPDTFLWRHGWLSSPKP